MKSQQNIIDTLKEKLKKNPGIDSTKLLEENKVLRHKIEEVSVKFKKLEQECKDYKRIVQEQAEIMKALNVRRKFYFIVASCIISTVLLVYNDLFNQPVSLK